MKYFTSDWHLTHSNIIKLSNRPFKNVDEMDSYILNNIILQVNKRDEIFFLGDLAWRPTTLLDEFFKELQRLKVQFHWITGNHDKRVLNHYGKFASSVSDIKETKVNKHTIVMCHYPLQIWRHSYKNSYMLFGHLHQNSIEIQRGIEFKGKMLNVNLEFHSYFMYSEEEILEIMEERSNNFDYIERKKNETFI